MNIPSFAPPKAVRFLLYVLKKLELTSNEAGKQAVLAGLGYFIMPLIGIKNELRKGYLRIVPVLGLPIETTWSLIGKKAKKTAARPGGLAAVC